MQAIVCHRHGGPDVMRLDDVPIPVPTDREVLIRAEAIAVNFVDTMRRSGNHPAAPQTPFTPGIELCGRVIATGDGVTRFSQGDRVIGRCVTHGAYAEYVCVNEQFTVACPETLSPEQGAALFVVGQTAYHALITVGKAKPEETVLITAAAGGVGICAVQIATLIGAHVIGGVGATDKSEFVLSHGADEFVNYREHEWAAQVLKMTHGHGADLILDSVGGNMGSGFRECWALRGRIVIYGQASGQPLALSGDELLFGNRSAHGLAVGPLIENESVMRTAMEELIKWVADGRLKIPIGQSYTLGEAAQAHRDLENRKTVGKLILLPASGPR